MKIFFFSFFFFWFCWSWQNSSRWLWCRLDKKKKQNATKNCLTVAQFSILFNSVKAPDLWRTHLCQKPGTFWPCQLVSCHACSENVISHPAIKRVCGKNCKNHQVEERSEKPLDKPQLSSDNIGLQVFFLFFFEAEVSLDKSHKRSPPYSGNVKECALVKPPRLGPSGKESTKGKRQVEDTNNIKRHRRHTNIKARLCRGKKKIDSKDSQWSRFAVLHWQIWPQDTAAVWRCVFQRIGSGFQLQGQCSRAERNIVG